MTIKPVMTERDKLFENILVSICDINSKYRTEANVGDKIGARHITDRLLSAATVIFKD